MTAPSIRPLLDAPLLSLSGSTVTAAALLVAFGVIAGSVALAAIVSRSLRRVLAARGVSVGAQFSAAKIVRYMIFVLGAVVAAESMGLNLQALVAASTVVGIGIGFGLQNIAQNFISGLILLVEQPIQKGDVIEVGDALGSVDDIGLRATRIITRDEVTLIVPNSNLIGNIVTNHSRPTGRLRVHIPVGVAYESDPKDVAACLLEVARKEPRVLPEPSSEVRFQAFGDSSLDFILLVWVRDPLEDKIVSSALRFAISAAFREHGISMPFPQRDVHIAGLAALLAPASPPAASPDPSAKT